MHAQTTARCPLCKRKVSIWFNPLRIGQHTWARRKCPGSDAPLEKRDEGAGPRLYVVRPPPDPPPPPLKGCPTGKVRHRTDDEASEVARQVTMKNLRKPRPSGRTVVRHYYCSQCHGYHITSAPKQHKQIAPDPTPAPGT